MNALIIGGDRNGEFVGVLDGAQVWIDIRTATHHRIRKITNSVLSTFPDGTQKVTEAHDLYLAVHEGIVGPQEMQIVTTMLNTLALNAFTRAHGVHQEIPEEPPAVDRIVLPGQA